MLRKINRIICSIIFFVFLLIPKVYGVVADNRFLVPFLNYNKYLADTATPRFAIQPFLLRADSSLDVYGGLVGLFDFELPNYDLKNIDNALILSNRSKESIFRSDLRDILVFAPYSMEGKLDVQGISTDFYIPVNDYFAFGGRWAAMQVNSRIELLPDLTMFSKYSLGPGDEKELSFSRERAHELLGLEQPCFSKFVPGDLELFARLFTTCEYEYRLRFFEAGVSLGFLFPVAPERDINNPASIEVGGNGHYGLYVEANLDAILKQDLRAGFTLRLQKRFSQRGIYRVPVENEPTRFGALVGEMEVKRGATAIFSPYVMFERLRGGLGGFLGYTLVKHFKDNWTDVREEQTIQANLDWLVESSQWGISHVRVGAFYDFSEWGGQRCFNPVVHFVADIPVDWIIGKNACKTYGFSLIAEFSF